MNSTIRERQAGRSALDAIKIVQSSLNHGYTDVADADLSKYFDTIPHSELLKSIVARIASEHSPAAEAVAKGSSGRTG